MNLKNTRILIIVENLPLPFDRRVWQEANTLKEDGADVFIICPRTKEYNLKYELINGIHIYRHPLPYEANGIIGYLLEYSISIFWEFYLSLKIFLKHGFDIIHICNPPDLIFLAIIPFKLIGKKVIFDHHDINPELYVAKFGKKDFFYKLVLFFELMTFRICDISIATNESYKKIAINRGGMKASDVFVVRSGPKIERMKIAAVNTDLKKGKKHLISYVGVIGQQEGIDHLLEAIDILINQYKYTDFHCIICGGGPALDSMITLSKKMNINSFVEFTNRISDNQLLEILNTADICVNPDVWNEMNDKSTMNKIMEYMSLKKPIVQYDLVEGRFSAEESSLYAHPNDRIDFAKQILKLFKNPNLRMKMGEYGYNRVNNHLEWSFESPKLLNAYYYVLNKN